MNSTKNEKSFTLNSNFEAPINIKSEVYYYLKRYLFDILIGLPILCMLLLFVPFKQLIKKRSSKRIILGIIPIIIFKTYNDILKEKFDSTLFVVEDWSSRSFHNGLTLKDIAPNIILKYPSSWGVYYSFIWSLLNFELYFLYFNGGFLEKTIWWRFEPIIYQLFDKKVIMFPYGSDVWSINEIQNLKKKYGLTLFNKKYFNMDFKRQKRNYWWSKYVNGVFCLVDFVKFLPRYDILTLHGHILLDIPKRPTFKIKEKIKIVHFANDEFRKGTKMINNILKELSKQRNDFIYEILIGIPREELLLKLNNADVVIDTFIDGFLQYTTLESAIRGKVVFANLNEELSDFFKYINPEYYDKHFDNMPIINYDIYDFKEKLLDLLNNKKNIKKIGEETYDFTSRIIKENESFLVDLTQKLLNKRY